MTGHIGLLGVVGYLRLHIGGVGLLGVGDVGVPEGLTPLPPSPPPSSAGACTSEMSL